MSWKSKNVRSYGLYGRARSLYPDNLSKEKRVSESAFEDFKSGKKEGLYFITRFRRKSVKTALIQTPSSSFSLILFDESWSLLWILLNSWLDTSSCTQILASFCSQLTSHPIISIPCAHPSCLFNSSPLVLESSTRHLKERERDSWETWWSTKIIIKQLRFRANSCLCSCSWWSFLATNLTWNDKEFRRRVKEE